MELKSVSPAARNGEARQESEKRSANTPTPANAQGTLEIIVMPVDRRGRFTARLGDRVILKSTRQPLLDAARILLAEGVAPNTRIAMRHAGENYDALSSTVGTAASLTVVERDKGNGPVIKLGTTQITAGAPVRLNSFRLSMP